MNKGKWWLLHVLAGVFLILLLGFHMITMHLTTILSYFGFEFGDPLHYEEVLSRGKQVSYVLFYIVFLGVALFHGFYGLKNILVEIFFSEKYAKGIRTSILSIGLILFIVGSLSTIWLLVS